MSEVRVDNIIGENGTDAVKFTKGITVTGIATVGNVSVGSSVTASTFHGNGAGITGLTSGKLIKKSFYTITRQAVANASFPMDDTAPQIDEGSEFFSQAYTPSTANCDLYIFCSAGIKETSNVADRMAIALYVNDSTDALRVVSGRSNPRSSIHCQNFVIVHKMPSWGVSAKTFSLRAHKANSINYAGDGYASEKFGAATHASLFVIEEIAT